MRHRPSAGRGLGPVALLSLVLVLLVLGVGGTLGTLLALGHLPNPWKQAEPFVAEKAPAAAPTAVDHTGQVPCVVLGRPLKSYDRIVREDLVNPKSGELAVVWVPESSADPSWLREPGQILGRVVARDKAPGYILTEKDLLPKGTREGISGGVPPGKMALVVRAAGPFNLDAGKPNAETGKAGEKLAPSHRGIQGIHVLRAGDRFDLVISVPVFATLQKQFPQLHLGLANDALEGRNEALRFLFLKQAAIDVIVQEGLMVTDGSVSDDITIALEPSEITRVTQAFEVGHSITCVPRSGQPDEKLKLISQTSNVRIPVDENPLDGVSVIEHIRPRPTARKAPVATAQYGGTVNVQNDAADEGKVPSVSARREYEVFVESYPAGVIRPPMGGDQPKVNEGERKG